MFRKSCFSTDTFTKCLTILELEDELDFYEKLINKVNAPSPKDSGLDFATNSMEVSFENSET